MVCKTIKEFENRWKIKCNEIKNSSFSIEQSQRIISLFLSEFRIFLINRDDKEKERILDSSQILIELGNDINLALAIAMSHYKDKHGVSLWGKIFGEKPVSIDLNALKIENRLV